MRTFGQNGKNPPKIRLKKNREIDWVVPARVSRIIQYETATEIMRISWKLENSWNHIKWTYFRLVLAIFRVLLCGRLRNVLKFNCVSENECHWLKAKNFSPWIQMTCQGWRSRIGQVGQWATYLLAHLHCTRNPFL